MARFLYTYRGLSVIRQITRETLYTPDTVANATFLTMTAAGSAYRAIIRVAQQRTVSAGQPGQHDIGRPLTASFQPP